MKWVSVIFSFKITSVIPHRNIKFRINRRRLVLAAGVIDAVQVFQVDAVRHEDTAGLVHVYLFQVGFTRQNGRRLPVTNQAAK